ncbi:MAG: zinc-ribbon domain-containing protein [Christensenellales bacterium]
MAVDPYANFNNIYNIYNAYGSIQTVGIILLVVAIFGLIASIVLTFVFLPEKNGDSFTGFLAKAYRFLNFKVFWITTILKVLFIFLFITLLLGGLIILFISPLLGAGMIVGAFIMRWVFELSFVLLAMRSDLARIAQALAPAKEPAHCAQCGIELADGAVFCPDCGSPVHE